MSGKAAHHDDQICTLRERVITLPEPMEYEALLMDVTKMEMQLHEVTYPNGGEEREVLIQFTDTFGQQYWKHWLMPKAGVDPRPLDQIGIFQRCPKWLLDILTDFLAGRETEQ